LFHKEKMEIELIDANTMGTWISRFPGKVDFGCASR
jgi:hypothetical protein